MVYVHIPFCSSFCTYCGFYSEIPDRVEDFVEALCRETVLRADEIRSCKGTGTLYIGGGTPSILSLEQLGRIVRAVREASGNDGADVSGDGNPASDGNPADDGEPSSSGNTSGNGNPSGDGNPFREFTVEVNPDDIVRKGPEYVKGLMRLGVNRISMGVQSFDDRILRRMNRRHNASDAVRAYRILRECGVENISIDLIFGFPADFGNGAGTAGGCRTGFSEGIGCGSGIRTGGDYGDGSPAGGNCSMAEGDGWNDHIADGRTTLSGPLDYWQETLQKALEIGGDGRPPEHISAYQLSIEEGSTLEKMAADGRFTPLSDELCSAQYDLLCSTLSAAGYNHYEISNFALPGKEAVHNSAYWNHTPYVGLGPGAHSLIILKDDRETVKKVVRRWNIDDVRAYIKAYCHCTSPLNGNTDGESFGNTDGESHENTDGDAPAVTGEEILTAEQLRTEQIMLSLRTSRGIPCHILETSPASAAKVRRMIDCGSLVPVSPGFDVPRLRIPENRFFVSDDIIAELI